MSVSIVAGDLTVQGNLGVTGSTAISAGAVLDAQVAANAAIDIAKLGHVYLVWTNFDLTIAATPVAREEIVFSANAAYTITSFAALLNDTGTTTDVDFDLNINGVSALSAVVNITNADTDRAQKTGTISSGTLAADDVVSISLAVTTSTGAQGPFAVVAIRGANY